MLCRLLSITSIAALTTSLSACASNPQGGALSDYVGVGYTNVATTCGGGYQVYQQPVNRRLLVAAYPISEARQSLCQSLRGEPSISSVTGVRHEDGALEYI